MAEKNKGHSGRQDRKDHDQTNRSGDQRSGRNGMSEDRRADMGNTANRSGGSDIARGEQNVSHSRNVKMKDDMDREDLDRDTTNSGRSSSSDRSSSDRS